MSSPSPRRAVVGPSSIHGVGAFAGRPIPYGSSIPLGPLVRHPSWGGFNHSCRPNIVLAEVGGRSVAVALRNVAAGEELTVSYRDAGWTVLFDCSCGGRSAHGCATPGDPPEDPQGA
jgi:SET domain-containing protein